MKSVVLNIIDRRTKGVDTYHNHGSTWLIFTDEKKWVIELTKEGTLWYNFYFFQDCFKYVSLDVVENQHYITEWVENFIQNGVKRTDACQIGTSTSIEDAIQNGVKETGHAYYSDPSEVEDTIQYGVKETKHNTFEDGLAMEDAIQNGFKNTRRDISGRQSRIVDTIRDGVKRTELGGKDRKIDEIKDIVENGIKETESIASHRTWKSEEVIQNGVKETNPHFLEILNPMNFEPTIKEMKRMNEVNIVLENGIKETTPGGYLGSLEINGKMVHQFETAQQLYYVENVINDGIKEVKELPDKSGSLMGYGEYYARKEDRTYPHDDIVNDVIRDGIKETKSVHIHNGESIDSVIQNGIKETKRLKDDNRPQIGNIIKQTNWRKVEHFPDYTDRVTKKG